MQTASVDRVLLRTLAMRKRGERRQREKTFYGWFALLLEDSVRCLKDEIHRLGGAVKRVGRGDMKIWKRDKIMDGRYDCLGRIRKGRMEDRGRSQLEIAL